jgi:uncharacterized protein (DUF433 family)
VDDEGLIATYIEPNPYRPGEDEACLKDYGVPVWALIGYLQTPGADIERVAADYDVPIEAVQAARAYYHRYQAPIDARIAANNAEARHAA